MSVKCKWLVQVRFSGRLVVPLALALALALALNTVKRNIYARYRETHKRIQGF